MNAPAVGVCSVDMIHKKILFVGSLDGYLKRIIAYKEKKSLTLYNLFLQIIGRMFRVIWNWFRRYFLIVNPNYDFFGWRSRSLGLVKIDFYSANAETKSAYVQEKVDLSNTSSFLELGCNSGAHLFELAREFPHCIFLGIDFNSNAIEFARQLAKKEGLDNLEFALVDLQDRKSFEVIENGRWDLIFSWASLIYIHPKKISDLIDFCIPRTNRLVLIEQHKSMRLMSKGRLIRKQPTWIRDYVKIIKKSNLGQISILVKGVESHIWHPAGGYATLIDVQITA